MTKLIINIDSPESMIQLNENVQVSADPQTAVNKIIRYLRGALIGSNNGLSIQVTTRDTDPAASTAAMVKAKVDATVAAAALVDVAVSGTSTKGQTAQAKTNLAGGADAVAAAYNGLINKQGGGTGTLTVVANAAGVAGNKSITGNGTSDLTTLIGAGYTVSAGGALILKSGDVVAIAGGLDAVKASKIIQDLTYTADAAGAAGNSITVTYADTANLGAETCGVVSNDITVGIQTTVKALGTSSVQNTHVV